MVENTTKTKLLYVLLKYNVTNNRKMVIYTHTKNEKMRVILCCLDVLTRETTLHNHDIHYTGCIPYDI